jgi:hypothetical protein
MDFCFSYTLNANHPIPPAQVGKETSGLLRGTEAQANNAVVGAQPHIGFPYYAYALRRRPVAPTCVQRLGTIALAKYSDSAVKTVT